MTADIVSLSDKISDKFFVPRTFRNVVAASRRVEWLELNKINVTKEMYHTNYLKSSTLQRASSAVITLK